MSDFWLLAESAAWGAVGGVVGTVVAYPLVRLFEAVCLWWRNPRRSFGWAWRVSR